MLKIKIRKFINSKAFSLFIQFLILLSIIHLTLETVPSIHSDWKGIWYPLELIFVTIFCIEYILRLYVSSPKAKYFFSFYGLIDLFSILPTVVSLGIIDLRFIRSIRLLRVFRILKFARYSKAFDRLKKAFNEIKDELLIFLMMSLIILFIAASGIYFFENSAQPEVFTSIPHSLWWAMSTLTTVGYGDVYPITAGGKIFTFIILMIGLGVVAVPSGLFASALSKTEAS